MKYAYKSLNTKAEIEELFSEINSRTNLPVKDWYLKDGLKIYGYFYDEEAKGVYYTFFFCFGQTIEPDKVASPANNTIWQQLRRYGSSGKYKGLKDIRGNVVLPNIYENIEFLVSTDTNVYFKVEKCGKYGICRIQANNVENVAPTQYEDIFEAGEYTLGYIREGKVGFMSLNGECITEAKYRNLPDYNHFYDGKALTCLVDPNGIEHYINHYGDYVGTPEYRCAMIDDFGFDKDIPDALDAYEGDESNRWNTD